ncbi:MAG: hypothetical protein K2N82_01395, partial [Lachnospiraceae bacterium]|nr:hypothetical protein [Lachnospiraceae bacterium]
MRTDKVAKQVFLSSAYNNDVHEREMWEKEVFQSMAERSGQELSINTIDYLENFGTEFSNSLYLNFIMLNFMECEVDTRIKEIVNHVWIASWDSFEENNAIVCLDMFHDGSYLVKITTDLQIIIRKMTELYCVIMTSEFLLAGEKNEVSTENIDVMIAIAVDDIIYDRNENNIIDYIEKLGPKAQWLYTEAFSSVYTGGIAFVVFHEIGHIL